MLAGACSTDGSKMPDTRQILLGFWCLFLQLAQVCRSADTGLSVDP